MIDSLSYSTAFGAPLMQYCNWNSKTHGTVHYCSVILNLNCYEDLGGQLT
jgi:hypothetical protein